MSISLRDYQIECLQSILKHHSQGINKQLVHMATGAGKTVVFASLINQLNRRSLVLAHTCELLDQARDKINMIAPGLDVGIVKAGCKQYDKQIVISSIQSARQQDTLAELQKQGFSLCVYDEAHRVGGTSSRHVLETLGFLGNSKENLLVGFSATPFRSDSKGLGEVFDKIVYHKSIKDLITSGYLCKPVGIRIKSDLDLSAVATDDGDFVSSSLASVMDTPEMIELVVNAYVEHGQHKKAICFGVTVSHAQHLVNAFKARGINSESVHGGTPQDERESLLALFRSGAISILCNCAVLCEGFDEASIESVIMAKPTQSKGLFIQMCGRGLRLYPNKKECLILDFGSKTHSLCSVGELLKDVEEEKEKKPTPEDKMAEFAKNLPEALNKKLKATILEFDLLGETFTWAKAGQSFSLKATGNRLLEIKPSADNRFNVTFSNEKESHMVAKDLSFEYAHSVAEGFARDNRAQFIVSDFEAPWRQLPISEKQKDLLKSYGYKNGIDDLSRGHASLIISSGILKKKASKV